MQTIRLEILRHGPPHNQLLSPLTEYLALCENHQSVMMKLPFEHAEFMLRLKELQNPNATPAARELELEDLAQRVSGILSQVPGLIRELSERGTDEDEIFHLRLILSANELALLPFEIANAPQGFAGAGQPLFLQSQTPVSITREVRRVAAEPISAWPKPKILFAAASPVAPVPLEAHVLALRQVIDPWMKHAKDGVERRAHVAEHLTVLPQATLRQIEDESASGRYTHVHILAHGVPLEKGDDRRFGLMLHRSGQPSSPDVIDAVRIAKALRAPVRNGGACFACPAVVTLAACNAGNVGSVIGAGASIAHSLHEEGIPLVVASQFPLSFAGSVIMTKALYEGLLWGHDPRMLLVNLRRQLRTQAPGTQDWASIVAYASFPADLDQRLQRMRIDQAFRSLEAAMHHADRMLAEKTITPELRKKLKEAHDRIECLLPEAQRTVCGILASSEKRLAQLLWRMAPQPLEARDGLLKARKFYRDGFRNCGEAWLLVQALALTAVLQRWNSNDTISRDDWELARILSEREARDHDEDMLAWAHANLMELYLLAPVVAGEPPAGADATQAKATRHAEEFRNLVDPSGFKVHSTRQQLLRYPEFFAQLNEQMKPIAETAARLAGLLPESPRYA